MTVENQQAIFYAPAGTHFFISFNLLFRECFGIHLSTFDGIGYQSFPTGKIFPIERKQIPHPLAFLPGVCALLPFGIRFRLRPNC